MIVVEQQILDHLRRLDDHQRQQVLDYVRSLKPETPEGIPGSLLKQFVGSIPADDLDRMERDIEAEFGSPKMV